MRDTGVYVRGSAARGLCRVSGIGSAGGAQDRSSEGPYPMCVYIWALLSPSHWRAKPKSHNLSSGGSSSDSSVLSSFRSLPRHTSTGGGEDGGRCHLQDPPYVRVHVGFLVLLPSLCKAEVTQLELGRTAVIKQRVVQLQVSAPRHHQKSMHESRGDQLELRPHAYSPGMHAPYTALHAASRCIITRACMQECGSKGGVCQKVHTNKQAPGWHDSKMGTPVRHEMGVAVLHRADELLCNADKSRESGSQCSLPLLHLVFLSV